MTRAIKIFIITVFLSSHFYVYGDSSDSYLVKKNHLLNILYNTIQKSPRKKIILKTWKNLENKVKKFKNNEHLPSLIENEIYKTIVEYPNSPIPPSSINLDQILKFDSFFKKNKKELSPLAYMICQFIINDIKKDPKSNTQIRVLKMWVGNLYRKDVHEINLYFEQVLVDMINNISHRLTLFQITLP